MAKKKPQGLGKGLGALIRTPELQGEVTDSGGQSSLRMVPVKQIRPNPHQPRTEFNQDALQELSDSIREHGLIQPLIVTEAGPDDYTLIAGERRWRASQLAELESVPVVVKSDTTPLEMLELAIIENVQRADLNPLEEGLAYQQLVEQFDFTHAHVAKRMGKARSTITNTIRLLDLPERVQQAVVNGDITGGHARSLLSLQSLEQQMSVMKSIIQNNLSVRQTEGIVSKIQLGEVPKKKVKASLPPETADLEKQFRTKLGTRVNIEPGKHGGKVVIHYYSDEELQAVYKAITGKPEEQSSQE